MFTMTVEDKQPERPCAACGKSCEAVKVRLGPPDRSGKFAKGAKTLWFCAGCARQIGYALTGMAQRTHEPV